MPRRQRKSERPEELSMGCPRCGYDQSGVIASWQEQCPVEGTCSECGFDFLWADVLIRERQHLHWLYEHRGGLAIKSLVQTLLIAMLPWLFWKRVQPHHQINTTRAFGFCVFLFGSTALLSVVIGIAVLVVRRFVYGDDAIILTTHSFSESYMFVLASQFWVRGSMYGPAAISTYGGGLPAILALSVFSIGIAFCAAVAQHSRTGSGIRRGHLLRALAYSYIGPWLVYLVFAVIWVSDRISVWDSGSMQVDNWFSQSHQPGSFHWAGLRRAVWESYFWWGTYWWVMFAWITVWWLCALTAGFKLRGWWQIWMLGIILGIVATAFVAFFVETLLSY